MIKSVAVYKFFIFRKYEKLQSEIEKSNNDKALAKELSIMERELSTKEEEINAVIGLYKEVRLLYKYLGHARFLRENRFNFLF